MKYNSTLTRQKINAAALSLFVQQGVDATTTKQIAKTAGVAEGSLYRHYTSKQALVSSLYEAHQVAMVELLKARAAESESALAQLNQMIEAVFECFRSDSGRDSILFLLLAQHNEALMQNLEFETLAALVEKTLEAGQNSGEFRKMNTVLAGALVIGMVAQCIEYLAIGAEIDCDESITEIQRATQKLLEA